LTLWNVFPFPQARLGSYVEGVARPDAAAHKVEGCVPVAFRVGLDRAELMIALQLDAESRVGAAPVNGR